MTSLLVVLIIAAPFVLLRLTQMLRHVQHEITMRSAMLRDADTGIYSASAIDGMLTAEIEHMRLAKISGAVVVFELHGPDPDAGIRFLTQRVRANEVVYRYASNGFCMALWDVDESTTARAVARLGSAILEEPSTRVVNAGAMMLPSTPVLADVARMAAQENMTAVQSWNRQVAEVSSGHSD